MSFSKGGCAYLFTQLSYKKPEIQKPGKTESKPLKNTKQASDPEKNKTIVLRLHRTTPRFSGEFFYTLPAHECRNEPGNIEQKDTALNKALTLERYKESCHIIPFA